MSVIFKCIYGPELYRIYRLISSGSVSYSGNALERYSSTIMTSIQTALSVSIYTSPIIMTWLYRRDYFTSEGLAYLTKTVCGITMVYLCAFYIRGIGRVFNPVYRQFIDVHTKCMQNLSPENKVTNRQTFTQVNERKVTNKQTNVKTFGRTNKQTSGRTKKG